VVKKDVAEEKLVVVWYEEYKNCSCSFVARRRRELPGYCPRHGNSKKIRSRMLLKGPVTEKDYGYAGNG